MQGRTGLNNDSVSRPSVGNVRGYNVVWSHTICACPIECAGGPLQFLTEHLRDHCNNSKEILAQGLLAFFEPNADLAYSQRDRLQPDDDKEHIFTLVDFGFGDDATTDGAPRLHTSLGLVDAIFTDGFVTQEDPLLIWKNPATFKLDNFWMSYVKGHARACTALAMAVIAMGTFKDPSTMQAAGGSNLLQSLRAIRVRVNPVAADLMSVAFKNALLAHRGSFRQAHDVLTWIQKLDKVSVATGP